MDRMIKIGLFTVLLLLTGLGLQAQGVGGGLSLGFNAAQVDGDGVGGYNKIGPYFGGFAWYDFNDRIALQPEINYSQKGSRDPNFFLHLRYNYLEVPLMVNYRLYGNRDDFNLVVQGGPSVGVLFLVRDGIQPIVRTTTNDYSSLDYGAHLSLQLNFNEFVSLNMRKSFTFFHLKVNSSPYRPWLHRYFTVSLRASLKR